MAFSTPDMTAHLSALWGPVGSVTDRPIWQVLKVYQYLRSDGTLGALTQREMVSQ